MPNGIKEILDKTFGPPGEALKNLKEISTALNAIDQPKLRLVKSIIDSVGKVKGSPEEMQTFLEIIKLVMGASMEQLTAIRDITANLLKLIRFLPKESLQNLPGMIKEFKSGG